MSTLWPRVNRWLTWFHRWSGVVLCLLFIAWFASGAVLLYVPYPALAERDRLAHSEPVDASRLTQRPAMALAKAPGSEQLLLISVAGRPIYLAYGSDGRPVAVPPPLAAPVFSVSGGPGCRVLVDAPVGGAGLAGSSDAVFELELQAASPMDAVASSPAIAIPVVFMVPPWTLCVYVQARRCSGLWNPGNHLGLPALSGGMPARGPGERRRGPPTDGPPR